MKTAPDALRTTENEFRELKTCKTGPNTLGTTENESRRANHENRTRRSRYRRKLVRQHKR
jgi:hypothetical protein